MSLYSVRPCSRKLDDPAPGVRLERMGEMLNRLSPDEARELGGDLILAAGASEAQWGQGSRAAGPQHERDPDNDHRFESAGVDGYEL